MPKIPLIHGHIVISWSFPGMMMHILTGMLTSLAFQPLQSGIPLRKRKPPCRYPFKSGITGGGRFSKISFRRGPADVLKLALGKVRPTFWKKYSFRKGAADVFESTFRKGQADILKKNSFRKGVADVFESSFRKGQADVLKENFPLGEVRPTFLKVALG